MIEPVSVRMLEEQLRSLHEDLEPSTIKLGMLHNASTMRTVARSLKTLDGTAIICDPVMVSTSGAPLLEAEALSMLRSQVMPLATLITPNLLEAELLAGCERQTGYDRLAPATGQGEKLQGQELTGYVELLADKLLALGARAVLITGGDATGEFSQDYFSDGREMWWLTSPRFPVSTTHGSGCTLSSSIAAAMATGFDLLDSLVIAKAYINQSLRTAPLVGHGHRPLGHQKRDFRPSDLPLVTEKAHSADDKIAFARDGDLAFYPIIDSSAKLPALMEAGVNRVQLRIKDLTGERLKEEIIRCVALTRNSSCHVYINDYWKEAIEFGAFGVHLGQTDLDEADCHRIAGAGLRLGISTHCHFEVSRAIALAPSYIAVGPIFETPTKKMRHKPQGMQALSYWCQLLDYPLVAIGGMTTENAGEALERGADSIAAVRDINECANPTAHARRWLQLFDCKRA
jgi:hydroxymethylpyrimidine kinase/phosphomethylpyrimidine kinase/thiamine-phosphate diphosphorylase